MGAEKRNIPRLVDETIHERDVIDEIGGVSFFFNTLFPGNTVYEDSAGELVDGYGWDLPLPIFVFYIQKAI